MTALVVVSMFAWDDTGSAGAYMIGPGGDARCPRAGGDVRADPPLRPGRGGGRRGRRTGAHPHAGAGLRDRRAVHGRADRLRRRSRRLVRQAAPGVDRPAGGEQPVRPRRDVRRRRHLRGGRTAPGAAARALPAQARRRGDRLGAAGPGHDHAAGQLRRRAALPGVLVLDLLPRPARLGCRPRRVDPLQDGARQPVHLGALPGGRVCARRRGRRPPRPRVGPDPAAQGRARAGRARAGARCADHVRRLPRRAREPASLPPAADDRLRRQGGPVDAGRPGGRARRRADGARPLEPVGPVAARGDGGRPAGGRDGLVLRRDVRRRRRHGASRSRLAHDGAQSRAAAARRDLDGGRAPRRRARPRSGTATRSGSRGLRRASPVRRTPAGDARAGRRRPG